MCGISGFLDTRLSLDEKKGVLTKMMSAIAHRGPDDFGSFVDDDVALGFRRLSIIDVAAGHQPLCNEDASLWLTAIALLRIRTAR
ncbi:MAG: Asparagine synthetase (glutamine-hydrolyzing) 1 [Firmicutes bacterium]|nr:Asparagine synthetase (glutamine-hydrolyzing) 1 [candidate division NPL-UPA2 bacterium]